LNEKQGCNKAPQDKVDHHIPFTINLFADLSIHPVQLTRPPAQINKFLFSIKWFLLYDTPLIPHFDDLSTVLNRIFTSQIKER
jgi:hypothetical protein